MRESMMAPRAPRSGAGRLVLMVVGCSVALCAQMKLARAEGAGLEPQPGMTCTVADGWWSLDRTQRTQPEPVKLLKLQALVTAEPGAWVQPLRGPMTDYHYHIALNRISDCRR